MTEKESKPQLFIPVNESPLIPELTILIPALNEALTIGDFIDWCREGIKKAQITGEILIVDSSTDNTAEIALSKGSRVLKTTKKGLGKAYIDGLPFVRGKFLILGDSDCTYDFRELKPFIDEFRKGTEYIMGSRIKGYIEPGAMPWLHRYFGTPLTTWILNLIYGCNFSDIHCGMRGITTEAFKRIKLQSTGWEYASELVLKPVKMKLKISEVPIRFYKDRNGRLSHHKRRGWLSPWIAGWDNLKAMFLYGADFLLLKPGFIFLGIGLFFTLLILIVGPVSVGPITFSVYWMLLGVCLSVVGIQCIYLGILAQNICDLEGKQISRWTEKISYNKGALTGIIFFIIGCCLCVPMVIEYISRRFSLSGVIGVSNRLSILGFLLMIIGISTFSFTLLLYATALMKNRIQE